MSQTTAASHPSQDTDTTKKAYSAPRFEHHGSVSELTETGAGGISFDGGTFPNAYTS